MQRRLFIASALTGALPRASLPQFVQPASRPYPGTFDIGSRKELFVDDVLIEEMASLSKVVTRPEKFIDNPVLRPDRPWEPQLGEKNAYGIGTAGQSVLYDPEERLFKIWYLCSGPPSRSFWCYATSSDGMHWEKPDLGIFDYQGSKKNNIVDIYGDLQYFNFLKDPNETDPRRRYKAMGEWENGAEANRYGGACVGYSADGLRWTPYDGNPVIKHGPNLGNAPTMLGWVRSVRSTSAILGPVIRWRPRSAARNSIATFARSVTPRATTSCTGPRRCRC